MSMTHRPQIWLTGTGLIRKDGHHDLWENIRCHHGRRAVFRRLVERCTRAAARRPFFGRVYSFHSQPSGSCPSLDWHVVVGANGTLSGVVGTNNMSTVFRVSGTVAKGKFHLDGKEIGGSGRTGTIDGQVRSADGWLIADISNVTGPSQCNNHTVTVQWYRYDAGTSGNG